MQRFVPLAVVALLFIAAGSAPAGIVPGTWNAQWVDTTPLTTNMWNWDEPTLTWDITETFGQIGTASFTCGAQTDEDPNITINKTIENGSAFDWTGFVLEIDPTGGAAYVAGSAAVLSGSHFGTITETNVGGVDTITFDAPNVVATGETLELTFVVNIPALTTFTLDIQQTPVPEPTSLALLGLAAAALPRRRR